MLPARFEQVTIWHLLLERWLTVIQWLKVNRGLVSVARTPVSVNHGFYFF